MCLSAHPFQFVDHVSVTDLVQAAAMIDSRLLLALVSLIVNVDLTWAQSAPRVDVSRTDEGYRIHVEADLGSPHRRVWAVLTDCTQAKAFVPHLESCRILARDATGRWDERENVVNPPFLPRIRTVVRNDYQPMRGFKYKLVSGDMKRSEGSWSLSPKGVGTHVVYDALVEPNTEAPAALILALIRNDLPSMFRKLDSLSRESAPQK